jgi:hypothetical protein
MGLRHAVPECVAGIHYRNCPASPKGGKAVVSLLYRTWEKLSRGLKHDEFACVLGVLRGRTDPGCAKKLG